MLLVKQALTIKGHWTQCSLWLMPFLHGAQIPGIRCEVHEQNMHGQDMHTQDVEEQRMD